MIQIRPVSDLRNKFSELEEIIYSNKNPIFLTKNGYGSMVLMSLETYENFAENIEAKLDKADFQANSTSQRLSHEEVFSSLKTKIKK